MAKKQATDDPPHVPAAARGFVAAYCEHKGDPTNAARAVGVSVDQAEAWCEDEWFWPAVVAKLRTLPLTVEVAKILCRRIALREGASDAMVIEVAKLVFKQAESEKMASIFEQYGKAFEKHSPSVFARDFAKAMGWSIYPTRVFATVPGATLLESGEVVDAEIVPALPERA